MYAKAVFFVILLLLIAEFSQGSASGPSDEFVSSGIQQ